MAWTQMADKLIT